ncbi:type VI secretion system tip protein TssI/VgrG [Chondromyces apiculatus]|uniref:VgrG protein n=1 Tax=Chondromyces apiculatus DSM 436 TaxID=1192034 RepID=A0A017T696_9BACT|nr:type VI secretion system tip protein TssI/VgrG [Chondromyces apiculatus]EYF04076.1 VgrG protein [Chondromyces apiculatus DSM 436]
MALLELSFSDSPADAAGMAVRHFEVQEGLSMLFEVALVVMSPSASVDLDALVGKPARFRVEGGDLGVREWAGLCFGAELLDVEEDGLSTYRVSLAPTLWLLTQRVNHRIFQHASAPEIAEKLLGEWGVPVELKVDQARHPKLEYRAQYGETDFAFLSRILEDAGISYFFEALTSGASGEASSEASKLVLADAPEAATPERAPLPYLDNPGERLTTPWASAITMATGVRPGKAAIIDYDFRRPRYRLTYRFEAFGDGEEMLEQARYAPGAGKIDLPASGELPNDSPVADGKSHARVSEHEGYALASAQLKGMRSDKHGVHFSSNVLGLAAGMAVRFSGHPKPQLAPDRTLIVTQVSLQGDSAGEWTLGVAAAFADDPIQPQHKTPRPRVEGLQSAIVVGPSGQEIHTDEFGRVRVRFHWDREGEYDDNRTAWVRVNEGWAGGGWGMMALPRVGHEVVVDFYEGNPDEPVIVGRMYNGAAPPPYGLPANQTKSVWRTRSTPEGSGYHEISFDDKAGFEEVYIRSERDLQKVVKNDESETARRDRTLIIASDLGVNVVEEDAIEAGGGHAVTMGKVEGASRVAESADPVVAEGATKREMIAGRITVTTGGATIQLVGPDIIVTAESSIAIRGKEVKINGGPFVQINPPVEVKQGDAAKAATSDHEVWFKLISDDGAPMADVTCYVEQGDGDVSAARRTDGRGMVRFPVEDTGSYRLVVGSPPPAAATPAAAAPAAPAAAAAPAATPAATPAAAAGGAAGGASGGGAPGGGAPAAAAPRPAVAAPAAPAAPAAAPAAPPAATTPAAPAQVRAAAPQQAITPPAGSAYRVRSGDSLGKIAAENNTTVGALLRLNPEISNPDRVKVGQQITLPASSANSANSAASPAAPGQGAALPGSGNGQPAAATQAPVPQTRPTTGPAAAQPAAQPAAAQPAGPQAPVPQTRPTTGPAAQTQTPPRVQVGETPAQPARVAQATTHAVPITIEVVSPTANSQHEIEPGGHPTPDPSMPKLKLQAKVTFQGQELSAGKLTWEFTISGTYKARDPQNSQRAINQRYRLSGGSTTTAPNEEKEFTLTPGELCGGDLELTVTFEGGPEIGNLKATKTVTGMKVKGKNAERRHVEALIAEVAGDQAWCLLRIMCHESVHRLEQFADGQPLFGAPAGVGIAQRDPVADEWVWPQNRVTEPNNFFPRIFWDWKKNVREGVQSFRNTHVATSRRLLARLRRNNPNLPEAPEGLVLRGAIRAYNGGNEFRASADGRAYVVDPFLNIQNGQHVALNARNEHYVERVLEDAHGNVANYPVPAMVLAERYPAAAVPGQQPPGQQVRPGQQPPGQQVRPGQQPPGQQARPGQQPPGQQRPRR